MGADVQATLSLSRRPTPPSTSNMTREDYMRAVDQVKEYIQAGDIFQLVLSHRFKRRTFADPFEIYRCAASQNLLPAVLRQCAMCCTERSLRYDTRSAEPSPGRPWSIAAMHPTFLHTPACRGCTRILGAAAASLP